MFGEGFLEEKLEGLVETVSGRVISVINNGKVIDVYLYNQETTKILRMPARYSPPLREADFVTAEYICADLRDAGKPKTTEAKFVTGVRRKPVYERREPRETEEISIIYIPHWGTYGKEINKEQVVNVVGRD